MSPISSTCWPATATPNAVLLYLETVTNTRKFISAARAAARLKPVIVIKSGRHAAAAKAAATHTGALAGTDGAVNAAFRRAGLLRVQDLEELFDAAETLARFAPIARGRLGIVTNGGGAGVLAVDQLVDHDGELAQLAPETIAALDAVLPATWSHANPVDIIGDAGPERYKAAIEAVFDDDNVDALLVMACPTALASAEGSAQAVGEAVKTIDATPSAALQADPHQLARRPRLRPRRAPSSASPAWRPTSTPADAIRSLTYLTGYSAAQRALMQTPPSLFAEFPVDVAAARAVLSAVVADGRTTLTEPEAKTVLAAFGVPVVETRVAHEIGEVEAIAGQLLVRHNAVAVKLLSRDVSHKSDVGGVVLGVRSPKAAARAAQGIVERLTTKAPNAVIEGFTVQAMVERPGAHELIVGIGDDPLFGPVILFGAGGTSVEVVADTAVALPPLDMKLADDLIGQTRIARLLAGYRDRPAADMNAIARALIQVSQMVIDCPEIASLDINPLLADADGVVALDARVVVDPERLGEPGPNRRLAIRPYPSAWERRVTTSGGRDVLLRPIRPEDARLYPDFVAKLDNRDIRLRLLAPRKQFSHDFLARLTQIDYAREMAFIAVDPDSAELLGVSRLVSDPDYTRAEYGVIVRSDLQGLGLGWALMEHLLTYARSEGLALIEGEVLSENAEMLAMCREMGFTVLPDPEDPGCFKTRLTLAA